MSETSDPDRTMHMLREAGFAVNALSEEQRQVLREISHQELHLLLDLKSRLDLAAPEVEGHAEFAGGALF